jgi:hypothetical protein
MAPQITPPPDRDSQATWPGGEPDTIRKRLRRENVFEQHLPTFPIVNPPLEGPPTITQGEFPMEFHFIMTLTIPTRNGGYTTGTFDGIYTMKPYETRMGVYNKLFDALAKKVSNGTRPNVLFFSLEPNNPSAALTA